MAFAQVMAFAEKHGRGWRARWRDTGGKLRSASGFATRRDAEIYAKNHEQNTVRYVVGTDDGRFYIEPYGDDETEVFTSKEGARQLAAGLNVTEAGYIPGPHKNLIKVKPWKVYELVEVE